MMHFVLFLFLFFADYCTAKSKRFIDRKNQAVDIFYQLTGFQGPYTFTCLKSRNNKPFVCKVDYSDRSYVVRFIEDFSDAPRIDEIALHQYAHEHGFGPEVLYSNVDDGIIIMEYFTQPEILTVDKAQQIDLLVDCVKKIHKSTLVCRRQNRFTTNCLEHFSYMINKKTPLNLLSFRESLQFLEACIDMTVQPVFVHGDLHRFNVFFCGDSYKAIDFESGHYDHPYVDLARLAVFFGFDNQEELYFLEQYWNRPVTQQDLIQFTIFKLFHLASLALWMLETLEDNFIGKIAFEKMFYIKSFKAYLEDPIFSDPTELSKENHHGLRYSVAIAVLKEAEKLLAFLQDKFKASATFYMKI
jgi:thiamine kinase-like enzyme